MLPKFFNFHILLWKQPIILVVVMIFRWTTHDGQNFGRCWTDDTKLYTFCPWESCSWGRISFPECWGLPESVHQICKANVTIFLLFTYAYPYTWSCKLNIKQWQEKQIETNSVHVEGIKAALEDDGHVPSLGLYNVFSLRAQWWVEGWLVNIVVHLHCLY